ncbi:MAG: PHP domain-containing protein [Bacteroidota bacterium]
MYLNCHTAFSFKYGTLTPASLVEQAQQCGVSKLIVTEINNTASLIELLRLTGGGNGPEIATGMEFREAGRLLYVMLAENNAGFEQINRFRSRHNASEKPLPGRAPLLPAVTPQQHQRSEATCPWALCCGLIARGDSDG